MIGFDRSGSKYIWWIGFSVLACVGLLSFGGYWVPEKITQEKLLNDPVFAGGIDTALLDVESKIKTGELNLQDHVPMRYRTENADFTVIKMPEEKGTIPYIKYRIEVIFRHPRTIFSRKTKLEAILVATTLGSEHVFADLFWNLE